MQDLILRGNYTNNNKYRELLTKEIPRYQVEKILKLRGLSEEGLMKN